MTAQNLKNLIFACTLPPRLRAPGTTVLTRFSDVFQGVKVKMDDQGNILVKKLSGKNVYVKSVSNAGEETSIGADVLKLPNYCLETDKPVKVSKKN